MNKMYIIPLLLFCSNLLHSQKSIDKVLKTYNNNSVPYISSQELSKLDNNIILLDAREANEYEVSHLKNAIFVGFDKFDSNKTTEKLKDKNKKIIVYCSLGVRSEKIGEKLLKLGYTNVYNLYGGIFDWKNNNFAVVDSTNQITENVHAFSKSWGKYLTKGNKIYK